MAVALAWTCSLFAQAHGVPYGSGDAFATMLGAASGRRQDQARPIYDELTE